MTNCAATSPISTIAASLARPSPAKVVLAAGIGTAFELYDFTLFAFFAVILAPTFFPSGDATTSLLLTLATFGIGAVMRPIGALAFGIYGDKVGRKAVLNISFTLMALGSVVIGIVPSYQSIGIWAPVLVAIARMVQGFSAGGELSGAATFVVEQVPSHRRGFYLGFLASASIGASAISASFGLALTVLLGKAAVAEWAWRIPFIFGGLVAPVGIYIRKRMPETEMFEQAMAEIEVQPIPEKTQPAISFWTMLAVACGFIPGTVVNYLGLVFMPSYLTSQVGVPLDSGFKGVLVASMLVAFAMPAAGALSDRIGRRLPITLGCAILLVSCYPMYLLLQGSPAVLTITLIQCCFALLMATISAPMVPFAAEQFPTARRSLGMALTMTLPITIFGVCSPLAVTWLLSVTGTPLAPSFYMMAAAAGGLLAMVGLRKKSALL